MKQPIYLDYNGTTPNDPEVIAAMRPFIETHFGNPSSGHLYGAMPRRAVETAREQMAGLLNCRPEEIVFTSGGTESNNHAIKGLAHRVAREKRHIITSMVEHPATLEVCRFLEKLGYTVTYVPVDAYGKVKVADIAAAVRDDTFLISIMHANNEVGTIEPIAAIAEVAKNYGIPVHTDAAQSVGKIETDVDALGVSMMSLAGHKVYAPKGVGALFIKDGLDLEPFCHGAGQESGRRAGTENVIEIVGLGKACELAARDLPKHAVNMKAGRDRLQTAIFEAVGDVRLNGHPDDRLPNTLNVSFYGLEANRILEEIGLEVAASAGAACHADTVEISHVLSAMGIEEEWAKGTLRFSMGRMTTTDEIDRAADVVVEAIRKLRS